MFTLDTTDVTRKADALALAVVRRGEKALDDAGKSVLGAIAVHTYWKKGTGRTAASFKMVSLGELSRRVLSSSKIAEWLDDGTPPHSIVPRTAKTLRFNVGGRVVFAKRVNHPGTKPINYTLSEAARLSLDLLPRLGLEALAGAVADSGW